MELPPLFLVRRKQTYDTPLYNHFALISTSIVRPPISLRSYPTFNLVEGPHELLEGGRLEHVGGAYPTNQWRPIEIYRPSTRSFATLTHKTEYSFTDFHWKMPDGASIPYLLLKNPTHVLPSAFYGIGTDSRCTKYSIRIHNSVLEETPQLIPVESVPSAPPDIPTSVSVLPQHLVNMVVEAAIEKAASCPISLEPLTKTSTRLTPCGHLVSHPSVEYWLSNAHSCPVCRQELELSALMKWTA